MLLLEGTEPEKESMTERLDLGGRMSRIDAIAHILNTAGSEVDGQPTARLGYPRWLMIWTFSNKSRRI
jgi:hypothetical protein